MHGLSGMAPALERKKEKRKMSYFQSAAEKWLHGFHTQHVGSPLPIPVGVTVKHVGIPSHQSLLEDERPLHQPKVV